MDGRSPPRLLLPNKQSILKTDTNIRHLLGYHALAHPAKAYPPDVRATLQTIGTRAVMSNNTQVSIGNDVTVSDFLASMEAAAVHTAALDAISDEELEARISKDGGLGSSGSC